MTTKKYLSQVFTLRQLIKTRDTRIQDLETMKNTVDRANGSDTMCELVATLLDLIEECQAERLRLFAVQKKISTAIASVERSEFRLILYERYINLKTWENIAYDNNYSVQWVHKLHVCAISAIERVMKKTGD